VKPRIVTLPSGPFAELVKANQDLDEAAMERSVETIARATKSNKPRQSPARKIQR
jgi:hypothetical protein